jgi:hypothetical protein
MAVRTDDLTLLYLTTHPDHGVLAIDAAGHVELLIPQVIELEGEDVSLAAFNASGLESLKHDP